MNETQFIDDRILRDNVVGHYEVFAYGAPHRLGLRSKTAAMRS